jgi:hypothetical protein
MTGLLCACPVTIVQAMGAVRATGLFWVAVLKRDPHDLIYLLHNFSTPVAVRSGAISLGWN